MTIFDKLNPLKKFKNAVFEKNFPNDKEIVKINDVEFEKFMSHIK